MLSNILRILFYMSCGLLSLQYLFVQVVFADVNVSASVSPQKGTVEDTFIISVTVAGKEASKLGAPVFESNKYFKIESSGQSSEYSMINGAVSSAITYTFTVYPDAELTSGNYELPLGQFLATKGESYQIKKLNIQILPRTMSASRANLGIDFAQIVDNTAPYVGQQVLYRAEVVATSQMLNGQLSALDIPDMWIESFNDKDEATRRGTRGNANVFSAREALFPTRAGTFKIPARTLMAKVMTGRRRMRDPFFDIMPGFSSMQTDQRIVAESLELSVRPLPNPPKANIKHILVGKVSINSVVDKLSLKEGESATLTITLKGDANLKPFELPDPVVLGGDDFKLYYDAPELNTYPAEKRIVFEKTFRIAIVPKRSGKIALPVLEVVTFDPYEEKYNVLHSREQNITVLPNPDANKLLATAEFSKEAQSSKVEEEKKDINIITQDLFPQHVGEKLFLPRPQLNPMMVWVVLIMLPIMAVGWHVYNVRYEYLLRNPSAIAAELAFKNALKAMDDLIATNDVTIKDANCGDSLAQIISSYLGDKYGINGKALTSNDVKMLVAEKTKNETLATEMSNHFAVLEQMRFASRGSHDSNETSKLLDETKKLLSAIEHNRKA